MGADAGARHAALPRQALQNGRFYRLGPYGPVAEGDRRIGLSRRRQEADVARDDPRRSRERAAGASRAAAGWELRQDAGQGRLGLRRASPRRGRYRKRQTAGPCERTSGLLSTTFAFLA